MIPHRIFYVWFGGEPPAHVQMCLRNWQHMLPEDWKIIRIGEQATEWFDFQEELKQCKWLRSVYERGMWAYVSDYIRCSVLHRHGGVYFDTDVTLERDITPLLQQNSLFLGWENQIEVNMSICGSVAGHRLLGSMLDFYAEEIWHSKLYTIPSILTHVLRTQFGLEKYSAEPLHLGDITLYPCDYFYPWAYESEYTPACITSNTYTIHWWGESWVNPEFSYFLLHKHLPGYDFSKPTCRRSYELYRIGFIRLLAIKEQQNVRRYYLFGFIPFLSLSPEKNRLLGFIPLSVKKKDKMVPMD